MRHRASAFKAKLIHVDSSISTVSAWTKRPRETGTATPAQQPDVWVSCSPSQAHSRSGSLQKQCKNQMSFSVYLARLLEKRFDATLDLFAVCAVQCDLSLHPALCPSNTLQLAMESVRIEHADGPNRAKARAGTPAACRIKTGSSGLVCSASQPASLSLFFFFDIRRQTCFNEG